MPLTCIESESRSAAKGRDIAWLVERGFDVEYLPGCQCHSFGIGYKAFHCPGRASAHRYSKTYDRFLRFSFAVLIRVVPSGFKKTYCLRVGLETTVIWGIRRRSRHYNPCTNTTVTYHKKDLADAAFACGPCEWIWYLPVILVTSSRTPPGFRSHTSSPKKRLNEELLRCVCSVPPVTWTTEAKSYSQSVN